MSKEFDNSPQIKLHPMMESELRRQTVDTTVIGELNSSLFQAAEIQNRIRKVQQLEISPLIDNYSSINEPHAHPSGLMNGINNQYLQHGLNFEQTTIEQKPSQSNLQKS